MYNVKVYDVLSKEEISDFYVKEHLIPRAGDHVTVNGEKYEVRRRNLEIDSEVIILEVVHTDELIPG